MNGLSRYIAFGLGIIIGMSSPCEIFAAPQISTGSAFLQELGNSSKRVSMDFKGANLNDVLKIFSQQSGLNFIAAEDVAGKTLNLYLDEVPVDEALERILSANGLTYELKPGSNIFVVKKLVVSDKELMTRVYPLKFASVSSSKLKSTLASGTTAGGGVGTSTAAAGGLIDAVKAILSSNGTLVEDTRTNSLIITDIPAQFPLIEQTIARLDVRIPQILIEVEMLDISKTTGEKLGAQYGDQWFSFTGASKTSYSPFDQQEAISKGAAKPSYTAGSISFSDISLVLEFVKRQTDTKSLARPRILTLNNETAVINIKTNEAIGVASKTNTDTAESVGEAERVETGVFLTVTPQANLETREITLAVNPRVIQARPGGTFEGKTFKDPEERGSLSILRVADGDTVVIGGLLRDETANTRQRVPFVGDIPILGMAFRHKTGDSSQRELIIFITPHVVKEDSTERVLTKNNTNIIREQTPPPSRLKTIQDELSIYEKRRF